MLKENNISNLSYIKKQAKKAAKRAGYNMNIFFDSLFNEYSYTQTPIHLHYTTENETFIQTIKP